MPLGRRTKARRRCAGAWRRAYSRRHGVPDAANAQGDVRGAAQPGAVRRPVRVRGVPVRELRGAGRAGAGAAAQPAAPQPRRAGVPPHPRATHA